MAIKEDGIPCGSVSGGCVEDDLIARTRGGQGVSLPGLITYGVTKEEAARLGLPCGGTLRLVQEPILSATWIDEVLTRTAAHELVRRTLDLSTGAVTLAVGHREDALDFDGGRLCLTYGPRWRLLLIGAGQLSQVLGTMAQALDFEVLVCDPRTEYVAGLQQTGLQWLPGMPDDVVREIKPDFHTAIVALTHDPRLDDMALMEALQSSAFYIGALGSRRNSRVRRERLLLLDLNHSQVARLHGPVGLDIGSLTPAEIAVSVLAEIVAVKNGVPLTQKKGNERRAASLPANSWELAT